MSHVLFISHARGLHGAEAVMVQAVKACVACGARMTVVVPSIAPDEGMESALQSLPNVRIWPLPYRVAGVHRVRTRLVQLYNLPSVCRLAHYVRREQVDTIYSCSYVSILGVDVARRTGVRHIWHWHEPVDSLFGWHASLTSLYRRWAQQTDTVLCISQQQLGEWKKTLGIELSNVRIVYNPIKAIEACSPKAHEGIRVGFIGHFEARKNLPLLVHVFEQLHVAHPETSLWLCGALTERDRREIEQLTALREPVVCVLPQTADVAAFYEQIDILVLPSRRETMPLVVLEAMQAGVCVIQTDQSGMNELVEDGKETLFFSPSDPHMLLQHLERCMNTKVRQTIAATGRNKALQLVTNSSFDETIEQLLCA